MYRVRLTLLTLVLAALSLGVLHAQADLRIIVGSATVAVPSSGNTLEVRITNVGTSASTPIAGFSFGLSVPGASGVSFTDVTKSTVTNPYIFAGNSSPPPFSFDSFPNQSFIASDIFTGTGGIAIAPGATFGLGFVTFSVSAGFVNPTTVTLEAFPSTSLSDESANSISFTGFNGLISAAAVPEPTTWALIGAGGAGLVGWGYRRYQRKQQVARRRFCKKT